MSIRSDRTYRFEQPPETIWAALSSVDQYTTWWPWLWVFDGTRLGVGERWHCGVKPQVPYTVEFDLELTEVVEFRQAGAELSGEISGRADLTLEAGAPAAGCAWSPSSLPIMAPPDWSSGSCPSWPQPGTTGCSTPESDSSAGGALDR